MTPEFLGALLAPEQQSNILYGAIGASVVLNLCLKSAVAVLNSYALQISKRTLSSIWQPSSAHTPMSYSQGFFFFFFFFFFEPILFWNTSWRLSPVVTKSCYICENIVDERLPHISPSPHQ
jgi:hypothetical protein